MCELVWLSKKVGAKRVRYSNDVTFKIGDRKNGVFFNAVFSDEAIEKFISGTHIDIAISGSRIYFRDGSAYALKKDNHGKRRYLEISANTTSGKLLIDWAQKYGFEFDLLMDEKEGLYCIDANGSAKNI